MKKKILSPIRLRELGVTQNDYISKKALKFILGGCGGCGEEGGGCEGGGCESGGCNIKCYLTVHNGQTTPHNKCCSSIEDCYEHYVDNMHRGNEEAGYQLYTGACCYKDSPWG